MTTRPKIAGKGDVETVRSLIALGYPAVADAVPDLIACIQDVNWPIGVEAFPFLVSIGSPLFAEIRRVFASDDETWKYWCIEMLKHMNLKMVEELRPEITRIADHPSVREAAEELPEVARQLLARMNASST